VVGALSLLAALLGAARISAMMINESRRISAKVVVDYNNLRNTRMDLNLVGPPRVYFCKLKGKAVAVLCPYEVTFFKLENDKDLGLTNITCDNQYLYHSSWLDDDEATLRLHDHHAYRPRDMDIDALQQLLRTKAEPTLIPIRQQREQLRSDKVKMKTALPGQQASLLKDISKTYGGAIPLCDESSRDRFRQTSNAMGCEVWVQTECLRSFNDFVRQHGGTVLDLGSAGGHNLREIFDLQKHKTDIKVIAADLAPAPLAAVAQRSESQGNPELVELTDARFPDKLDLPDESLTRSSSPTSRTT
jgi:hypothetical protein